MSSEKTGNLGLHKWAGSDGLFRTEFNDNFGKIDEKVAEIGDVALIPQNTIVEALNDKDEKIATVNEELAEKADFKDVVVGDINLVRNSDFEKMPNIYSRSSVYSFQEAVTNPQHNDRKSLKIEAINYESSADPNKDFAFMLNEKMMPNEKMKVSFWVYPMESAKTISIRMAYTAGLNVGLGAAGQWNKIEFILDLADMVQGSDYFYFNLKSSFVLYMSDFRVENITNKTEGVPISLSRVNEKLVETPTNIQNSNGIIERMIAVAQTYANNVNKLVYGNRYTAYDVTMDLVDGKNEIDCSSFANLLVRGIPYEDSRYTAGNTENKSSRLFFSNIDPYKWRYANTMAKYAYEKGYAFKPNADFSNVEAGDILFFSWNSFSGQTGHENAFMKIDHVAAFLHKKNDNQWSTLQFDNGISTVYYDATNDYMSQCVLVARFPFANVESIYPDDNLLLGGDVVKNVTNTITVSDYRLSKTLKKGRYYTFFIDGKVLTENCYFIIQVNNKTIYSDGVRQAGNNEVVAFRFPYLLDDVTDTISLKIGAPGGTDSNRSAIINWCSLYEGYPRNKKQHIKSVNSVNVKDFALDTSLVSDLNSNMSPYYKYAVEGNKLLINFSLPFSTLRTGNLVIGNIGIDAPKTTQRLPISLIGATNEAINAILQIASTGVVTIVPYSGTVQWRYGLANGYIFKE